MSEAGTQPESKAVSNHRVGPVHDGRGRALGGFWIAVLFALGMAGIVVNVAIFGGGARFDEATLALAAAAMAMVGALWGMFGMVRALLRPSVSLAVEAEMPDLGTPRVQLREEKKRVLRAIKELEFDYAMGKLSKSDFDKIAEHYKLRAVQVMRRLDEGERHPELQRWLSEPEVKPAEASAGREASETTVDPANPCATCSKDNDADAKFCKHCGASLELKQTAQEGEE